MTDDVEIVNDVYQVSVFDGPYAGQILTVPVDGDTVSLGLVDGMPPVEDAQANGVAFYTRVDGEWTFSHVVNDNDSDQTISWDVQNSVVEEVP